MSPSRIESASVLRKALHAIPHPLLIMDRDTILYANPAAIGFFRAENATQVLGKSPAQFVHPDGLAAMAERLELLFSKRAEITVVDKLRGADGSVFHAQLTGFCLEDGSEPLAMLVARELEP